MNDFPTKMFRFLSTILLVITIFSEVTRATKCVSFNNINLKTKTRYGEEVNITSFSGILERKSFGNLTLAEVYVRQQDVQDIGAECVRHMVRLKTLVFWGCPIKKISPGAFRNMPTIWNLQISYGNLTNIPAGVFDAIPTVRMLRLHDNEIHSIEEGAFTNLPDLKRLFMANNKIKVWENSWFFNTTNIEIMDFQGNQIEIIPSKALFGMSNLKQVFFDYNEIRTIESGSFLSIHNLEYLGLRYNRLKELNEDVFPNKLSVRSLLIDANYLNYLSNEVLKKLSVKDLTLDGNPWKCPCLDRIHYWIYTNNVTLRSSSYCSDPNIPLCFFPNSYSTTCLENHDDEMTTLYIKTLKKKKIKVNRLCARLD
ncbi:slit homolog 3 protein-like isoform X1 [Coccinella septempunctata]|uniref:slit homolog 3 protein-like isoform X1 n=1 Tax=Coccinella septempunctata TaxID=41139 RepID=UPI001D066F89|nr:slit homolog 3 protein-like isoform X1 [Coccinella septempunctata]